MCGIAGFVPSALVSDVLAKKVVQKMNASMHTRGPDAEGIWSGDGIVLGHRRLAILDLDARSNQPMLSSDGCYAIVFNGEIYNFRELRRDLEAEGVVFQTASDTEVLLALFARDGEKMLPKLRGMFAFAIWNRRTRELFLARDPYGIKPLYYAQSKQGFIFASRVKTLLVSEMVPRLPEPAGVVGFYLWGSMPEPWTLYRDVFALAAGHWMRVRDGLAGSPVCWHDIKRHWQSVGCKQSTEELQELVRVAVTDSVEAHLVSDVPVCVFLSGGIDSSVVAALSVGLGAKVEGITIGFEEFVGRPEDEVPAASAIAAHYNMQHSVHRISRDEFEQDVSLILDAMDQPSVDGVNTWFASKAAAERGYKVVLSGVGGDELFGGYPTFRQIPRVAHLGKLLASIPGARTLMRAPCAYFARQLDKPKLAAFPSFMDSLEGVYYLRRSLFLPGELPALLGDDFVREGLTRLGSSPFGMTRANARDGFSAVGMMESIHYLRQQLIRDSDWASMGHSLELRTPLVDVELLTNLGPYASSFADGIGKAMLARSPMRPLPGSIINRPKSGFSLPIAQWLSESTDQRVRRDQPMLAASGTPWARRWAQIVMKRLME